VAGKTGNREIRKSSLRTQIVDDYEEAFVRGVDQSGEIERGRTEANAALFIAETLRSGY